MLVLPSIIRLAVDLCPGGATAHLDLSDAGGPGHRVVPVISE
jgi:hypothetical protein